jgi:uncharacterized membrane protein
MKAKWQLFTNAYIFFGSSIYVGVLWALHFFWYPTWQVYTAANYYDHFIPPTQAATRFFTVVVPLMFIGYVLMVWKEWSTDMRWVSVGALLGLAGSTFVGQLYIIPINKILAGHITDDARVTDLMQQWMKLNDIRSVLMTISWLLLMYYFGSKAYKWDTQA